VVAGEELRDNRYSPVWLELVCQFGVALPYPARLHGATVGGGLVAVAAGRFQVAVFGVDGGEQSGVQGVGADAVSG
jgi:hypothetical protein